MNILLHSPSFYTRPVDCNFPYGIVALGSYLAAHGYPVRLVDGSVETDIDATLGREAAWADIMGVSLTTFQVAPGLHDIEVAKKANPRLIVVAGGVHPTLMPEQTIRHPLIDYVIVDEGEGALTDLIDALADGRPVEAIANLAYVKKDGSIAVNPRRPFIPMDDMPAMNWELLNNSTLAAIRKSKQGIVLAGKGCDYRCTFCFNPATSNCYRYRSADNMLAEIDHMVTAFGVKHMYVRDENFLSTRERALAVAEGLIARNYGITWEVLARVNFLGSMIDDDDIAVLVKSGLRILKFGAESGDQAMLNALKKGITVDQTYRAATMCRRHGVTGVFSFMTGIPGETWEQFMKTLDCIDRIRTIMGDAGQILGPHAFYVYPAGELYHESVRRGYRAPQSFEGWAELPRHPVTGLPEYSWRGHEHFHYIQNIAMIRVLAFVSLRKTLMPPYSIKTVRNLLILPLIVFEKIRWHCRWFGLGLFELRCIMFVKQKLFGTKLSSI